MLDPPNNENKFEQYSKSVQSFLFYEPSPQKFEIVS